MPYDLEKRGDKWCVVKRGAGTVNGGCHDTKAEARDQQSALYAKEAASAESEELRRRVRKRMWRGYAPTSEGSTVMAVDEITSTSSSGGITVTVSANTARALRAMNEMFGPEPAANGNSADTPWEGVLAIAGAPTSDKRFLMPDELGQRDLPLPLMVQTATDEGHGGAEVAGRIESIVHIPVKDFAFADEFNLGDVPDTAVVVWATGVFDGSPAAAEAERLIANGAGVSIDIPTDRLAIIDPKTFEEVDPETVDMADVLSGKYLTGIGGKIAGATIVTIPAFEEASVRLTEDEAVVASAAMIRVSTHVMVDQTLTAAGSQAKPSAECFDNPNLLKLTPLTIGEPMSNGYRRVSGHLADWDGCHTGFAAVCVPPFRSQSDYAYFNVGEIETDDGQLIPVGKLMFSREMPNGHAPTSPEWGVREASKYYDDSTKIGGFVRAGSDRYGTWLAGVIRPDITDEDLQILRANPPSGDWRPIPGKGSELVAAFCVPVPGFPIPRSLVASAENGMTIITGPLQVEVGPKERIRKTVMLRERLNLALCASGLRDFELESEEFADITSEQRRRWAKSGVAMPDGSFPVVSCTGDGPSAVNARRAIGRAPESKRGRVRAHIAKRERVLGCSTD